MRIANDFLTIWQTLAKKIDLRLLWGLAVFLGLCLGNLGAQGYAPSIVAHGPTDFCAGDSVLLEADTTYDTYSWFDTKTSSLLKYGSGPSNKSIWVYSNRVIVLSVTGTAGVGSSPSQEVNESGLAASTLSVVGDTVFCEGESTWLALDSGFADYQWFRDSTLLVSGPSLHKISVSLTGSYWAIYSDSLGYCADTSNSVFVCVHEAPNPKLNVRDTLVCPGASLFLFPLQDFDAYQWLDSSLNPIAGDTNKFFSPTKAGIYYLSVKDSNGCWGSSDSGSLIQFHDLFQPLVDSLATNQFCGNEGMLIRAQKSSYPNYQWYRNGSAISSANADSFWADSSGLYHYEVLDSNSCAYQSDTVALIATLFADPLLSVQDTLELCASGNEVLSITFGFSEYLIFRNDTLVSSSPFNLYDVSQGGWYYALVYDSLGCAYYSDTLVVIEVTVFSPEISTPLGQTDFCGIDSVVLSSGAIYDYYEWYFEGVLISTNDQMPSITVFENGAYTLRVTDSAGCEGVANIDISFRENPLIEIFKERDTVCLGEPVRLSATGGIQFHWISDKTLIVHEDQEEILVTPLETSKFVVEVTDKFGCSDTISTTIQVIDCDDIIVPNAFSPNEDGINDTWVIRNIFRFPANNVEVYSRWGSLVFSGAGYDNSWDAENLPSGTYYYVIDLGTDRLYKGSLSIIR